MSKPHCITTTSRKAREFEKREREILDVALRRFCSDDWESVTVAQIARDVGIAKGTMYLHFASKHEIYARLALDFYRSLQEHLHNTGNGNALQQLRQMITQAFEFHFDRPAYRRVTQYCERDDFRRNVKDEIARELDDIDKNIEASITTILSQGIAEGLINASAPQPLILCLQCTFQGALTRFWCNRHGEQNKPDEFVDAITRYMLDTITANAELQVSDKMPDRIQPCSPLKRITGKLPELNWK